MVVLGHSIIIYSSEWNIYSTSIQAPLLDFLKRIINLIQMPLFFSLSGYLFLHSLEKRGKIVDLVFIRVKRLLLPYMVFCIFWLLPIRLIIKYPGYSNYSLSYVIWNRVLLGYDNGHMWYLPTLFLCFLFSLFAYKMLALCQFVGGGTDIICLLLGVLLFSLGIVLSLPSYIGFLCRYYIWFALGHFIGNYRKDIVSIAKYYKKTILLLVCGMAILSIVWQHIIIQFCASVCLCILFYILIPDKYNKILAVISDNSFGIYLFHSPLVYITYTYLSDKSPFIVVSINFIVFGILSFIVTYLLRNSRFKMFIGG